MWKTNTSDVYIATRTLGGSMKASLHASGRCHVRAPDPQRWRGAGEPPRFLDAWDIDTASNYQFPLSVVIPERELRRGEWAQHREKGTVWVEAPRGGGIEVAIFVVRASGDLSSGLIAAGWGTHIVDALLPDGRRLIVVAGHSTISDEKLAEIAAAKSAAQSAIAGNGVPVRNPRMLLLTGANEQGTRKFVEVSALQ